MRRVSGEALGVCVHRRYRDMLSMATHPELES
jgi:hypothetical protein